MSDYYTGSAMDDPDLAGDPSPGAGDPATGEPADDAPGWASAIEDALAAAGKWAQDAFGEQEPAPKEDDGGGGGKSTTVSHGPSKAELASRRTVFLAASIGIVGIATIIALQRS